LDKLLAVLGATGRTSATAYAAPPLPFASGRNLAHLCTVRAQWKARQVEIKLEAIVGREFSDEAVHLDGKEFIGCKFQNCELLYAGGLPFILDNSPAEGCHIAFVGAALNTMNTLSTLYAHGLHDFVEQMFERVRDPLQESLQ
jgi:hypothetical protein